MLRVPFILVWNLLKFLSFLLKSFFFRLSHFLTRNKRKWVHLKLPPRQPFALFTGWAARLQDKHSYLELRAAIERLSKAPHLEGVLITADNLTVGPAQAADLRALIRRLQNAGKSVLFHTHSIMGRDFDLAMAADKILMTPGGRFYVFGLRFENYFAAPLLDKLGVAAQFVHIGPFKTAAHRFIHDRSTLPLNLMMNQLLEGLTKEREARIQTDRPEALEYLDQAFSLMPLTDRQALFLRFIDAPLQRRLIRRWIEEGEDFLDSPRELFIEPDGQERANRELPRVAITDAFAYVDSIPAYHWTPIRGASPIIATVDLSGMIVMSGIELPGQTSATIDPDQVLPLLHRLATNPRVAAVILYINSPGGNALASELLWDGIRRLNTRKPTIAYLNDVAASGGYYMAVGTDHIICHPETITGSIGVIAGKLSFPGLLDKLGVVHESIQHHDTSQFLSPATPLSEDVLQNLRSDARSFYRQFLRRVGQARQLPRRRLHRYARGRVYTGRDAHRRGLVDHLGGFDDALALAKELAGLPDDTPLIHFHHRKITLASLLKGTAATSPLLVELPTQAQELRLLHALLRQDPLLAWNPIHRIGVTP